MAANPDQNAWIQRVLGFDPDGAARAPAPSAGARKPLPPVQRRAKPFRPLVEWQGARERADEGIEALAARLKGTDDAELHRIAEFGLGAVTQRLGTRMTRALMEFDSASPDARAGVAGQVRSVVGEYRAMLAQEKLLNLLENNPFGVAVSIRAPLVAALDRIDAELSVQGGRS